MAKLAGVEYNCYDGNSGSMKHTLESGRNR